QADKMPIGSDSFFRWLGFFLSPYMKIFVTFTSIRVVRFVVLALLPLAIGWTINAFDSGLAFENPELVIKTMVGYMALYGIALLSIVVFSRESAMQDRMIRAMTLFSIAHMNKLPLAWHEAQGSGGKMQRIMTARNSVKQLYNIYKWSVIPFVGSMIGIFASVIAIKAPFYFVFLYMAFMASFFVAAWLTGKVLPHLHNKHNTLFEKLLSGVYEFVSSVRTVRAFHMQDYIERRARAAEGEGHDAMRAVFGAIFRKWSVLNMTGFLWMALFVGLCMAGIYNGTMTTGAFATVFFLAHNLWTMLEGMVFMQDEFYEHRNGFMRLTETLKAAPHDHDVAPLQPFARDWKTVSFNNVGYVYEGKEAQALRDINLPIKRGEKIALVGRSGAGKSTLVKLLMKQMIVQDGIIRVDNTDIRHIESGAWLTQIGYVPQDVELFNMSMRDNILLDRRDDADEEAYNRALDQASLRELIDSLPEGDATIVGERGVRLSGGQRQRLGIARALVRDSQLIIFDEATSALDSLSEQAIQQAIEETFDGRTVVLIAHRLSTVRKVDRIIVLEDGRIIEQGSFDELLHANGPFARMWALQSGGFEEKAVASS
ncbi:MAG: ABC transporter ATP-binding protein/permease, partial [Alphaproteobacteria bacterium]|nr:ABC transporter ATP-binding protein/permease [Alphaproteobacteria bacterium]